MAPERNRPNPVSQRSPIVLQKRSKTINNGDPDDEYDLNVRNRLQVNTVSGDIRVKFLDSNGDVLKGTINGIEHDTLDLDASSGAYETDFQSKQSTPSKVAIEDISGSSSDYDILIERV